MTRTDTYAQITTQLLAQLEAGTAPWVRPWSTTGQAGGNTPYNADTGRRYSGGNVVLLWMAAAAKGYTSNGWLTYRQAQACGGQVRAGEKSTTITLVKRVVGKPRDGEETGRAFSLLRTFAVFNTAQCDGLPARIVAPEAAPVVRVPGRPDPLVDAFVAGTGARIQRGGDVARYIPSVDRIDLPLFATFKTPDHYYATAFHELAHWTGSKARLDRTFGERFGDEKYAFEELVAELTAAFLCAEWNFDGSINEQAAAYLATWAKVIRADGQLFFSAASMAQKAADYLRGLVEVEQVEQVEEAA